MKETPHEETNMKETSYEGTNMKETSHEGTNMKETSHEEFIINNKCAKFSTDTILKRHSSKQYFSIILLH